ncbi:DUF86 domain-containing protein [Microcoleus sp. w1-18aA5]|uniref:HepT-like ribonuclease domain-containing protein n=1 Tax=unclassified Microcoleus TaxID=2642155 RepID=UPI002FD1F056
MPANDRDSASLWGMEQAIRRIQQFTTDASYDTYLESVFMQSAVERQLGILGEAARRVLIEFQQFHPEIDWRNAINLRNILVHRYDQARPEVIWNLVTSVLPGLLVQLEALLPPLPDDT